MSSASTNDVRRPRGVLVFLAVWALLQLPRFIAVPLIADVAAGTESDAWMYPAVLDIVAAVAAIPVAALLFFRRGLLPWVLGILFFTVSIIDHGDAVTAALLSTTPEVFGGEGAPASARFVPALQAVLDVVALVLLSRRSTRAWFGVLPAPQTEDAAEPSLQRA